MHSLLLSNFQLLSAADLRRTHAWHRGPTYTLKPCIHRRFPWKDEQRAKQWISNISRQTSEGKPRSPSIHDRVCSKHFTDSDYQSHTKTKTLKPGAVPTIFPNYPKHKLTGTTDLHDHTYPLLSIEENLTKHIELNRLLIEKLNQAKKEIKTLKQKFKRRGKKIEDLFKEIKDKNFTDIFDGEKLDLITSNLSEESRIVSNIELQLGQVPAHGRRYSEEMRSFAVTLHFYSAQAYEFLKKKLNSALRLDNTPLVFVH
ncbi:THAP domain containing 6 [Plakobranchus ocellatus]|uniref:THAP domain containing 6 n=1 Tax=Plakobranchus ocellatus TaxID=259542 RepID=A0AAV4CCT5_9GAST|nr:THAP domain containing 6 [Plakobranchus ocellatus]